MAITKKQVEEFLPTIGFVRDAYGNYKKHVTDRTGKVRLYRYKLKKLVLRVEQRVDHPATEYSPASHSWIGVRWAYYKDLYIVNGKITKEAPAEATLENLGL